MINYYLYLNILLYNLCIFHICLVLRIFKNQSGPLVGYIIVRSYLLPSSPYVSTCVHPSDWGLGPGTSVSGLSADVTCATSMREAQGAPQVSISLLSIAPAMKQPGPWSKKLQRADPQRTAQLTSYGPLFHSWEMTSFSSLILGAVYYTEKLINTGP